MPDSVNAVVNAASDTTCVVSAEKLRLTRPRGAHTSRNTEKKNSSASSRRMSGRSALFYASRRPFDLTPLRR